MIGPLKPLFIKLRAMITSLSPPSPISAMALGLKR
jgi:hypothetical protein